MTQYNITKKKRIMCILLAVFEVIIICSLTLSSVLIRVINNDTVEKSGVLNTYVDGLYNDINDYTKDLCLKNSIDNEISSKIIIKSDVSFVATTFCREELMNEPQNASNYKEIINDITDNAFSVLKSSYPQISDEVIQSFCDDINSYFNGKIAVEKYSNIIKAVDKIQQMAYYSLAICIAVAIAIIIIFIRVDKDNYSGMTFMSDSIFTSGISILLIALVAHIIMNTHNLYLFPLYVNEAITKYIMNVISYIAESGGILIFISVITSAIYKVLRKK